MVSGVSREQIRLLKPKNGLKGLSPRLLYEPRNTRKWERSRRIAFRVFRVFRGFAITSPDSMGAVPRILLQDKQTDLLTPTVFAILEW